jgi:hypothetical protein
MTPNPSLEPGTSTGLALGPRGAAGLCSASRAKHQSGSGPSAQTLGRCGHSAGCALATAHTASTSMLPAPVRTCGASPPASSQFVGGTPAPGSSGAFVSSRGCRGPAVQLESRRRPRLFAPKPCKLQSPVPRRATSMGRRALATSLRSVLLSPGRRPNHHSSGPPPAWHLGREALRFMLRLAAQAPYRRRPAQLKR